jgi:hypothetical protein
MDKQMNQEDRIDIHPTGKTEQERICYSDDALTALFNAHIALANNEEQTTWQRYNIMLVANSIIIGSYLQNKELFYINEIVLSLFGLLLCVAWYSIHNSGRSYHARWMQLSRRFHWISINDANPIMEIFRNPLDEQGVISCWSNRVIFLFGLLYLIFFIVSALNFNPIKT